MKMKMIIAIVNSDDAGVVNQSLIKNGFRITKLPTQGGFLRAGNTTFLIGVEEEKVQEAIDIIHEHSNGFLMLFTDGYCLLDVFYHLICIYIQTTAHGHRHVTGSDNDTGYLLSIFRQHLI